MPDAHSAEKGQPSDSFLWVARIAVSYPECAGALQGVNFSNREIQIIWSSGLVDVLPVVTDGHLDRDVLQGWHEIPDRDDLRPIEDAWPRGDALSNWATLLLVAASYGDSALERIPNWRLDGIHREDTVAKLILSSADSRHEQLVDLNQSVPIDLIFDIAEDLFDS